MDTCHGGSALSDPGAAARSWRAEVRDPRSRARLRTCVRTFSLNTLLPACRDREPRSTSGTGFPALLSPSSPGAAALQPTGPFSSCPANSGAASSHRAGAEVHVRVSHPGKKPRSGSAASWPRRFGTGQGRRQTIASCPLLGHRRQGMSVSLHPGVGEAAKAPSPRADGDGDLAQEQPRNHSPVRHGPQRAQAVGHGALPVSVSLRVSLRCLKHGRQESCSGASALRRRRTSAGHTGPFA